MILFTTPLFAAVFKAGCLLSTPSPRPFPERIRGGYLLEPVAVVRVSVEAHHLGLGILGALK